MRLIIADDDASLRKQLKRYFESRGHQVRIARDGIEAWHLLREDEPDAVLTDVYMPDMNGVELVRTIRRNPGTRHLPVVLFSAKAGSNGNGNGHLAATEGVDFADEVLPKPLDLDLVEARVMGVLRRISEGRPDRHQQVGGQVVVITSAKGGAGVSSITANVALAVAQSRTPSVIAVDLDLEYGDLPMLVDVPPRSGVDELIDAIEHDGATVTPEDYVARHATGLRVLGAPRRPVDALRVGEHGVTALVNILRAMHDTVLVDVPHGFSDPALTALALADRVVVVVTPEVTALRRTLTLFEILRDLDIEEERQLLVLNGTVNSPELTRERVEGFLRRRIPVAVPHALDLFHRATTSGHPAVLADPKHAVSQELVRLSHFILEGA
ncbi:MAG TPA: response regulator [Candidatus Angelobacter sp.]|jgi:pilus assembly protein CpaE|nr:response regulator [Candidatus Angelobacter sp.]